MKTIIAVLLFMFGAWQGASAVASAQARPKHWSERRQKSCESTLFDGLYRIRDPRKTEVDSGFEYGVLRSVATDFRRADAIPHLYVIRQRGSSEYLLGSRFDDGRGKIILTADLDGLDAEGLRGFFGHAMATLIMDQGLSYCESFKDNPDRESAVDACAAQTVGQEPIERFLGALLGTSAKSRIGMLGFAGTTGACPGAH